ncbi:MAG: helix-turn-helix transcriptional regulator [bacterium]|nr:helix-turn-helix transcriptional regulator [bacterium]
MYKQFIRQRITELRVRKNISEYQLSIALGHSKGYIQSITSGHTLPSMEAFLEICDYFKLTPSEFFLGIPATQVHDLASIIVLLQHLSEHELIQLLSYIEERLSVFSSTEQ